MPSLVPKEPKSKVVAVLSQFEIAHQRNVATSQGWIGRFIDYAGALAEHARELYGALIKLMTDVVVIVDPPEQWGSTVFQNPPCGYWQCRLHAWTASQLKVGGRC